MLEIYWIKSLLYFLLASLYLLLFLTARAKQNYTEARLIMVPALLLTISEFLGFIYFTPWLKSIVPMEVIRLDPSLQFMVGPWLIYRFHKESGRPFGKIHWLPTALSIYIMTAHASEEWAIQLIFLTLQVHMIAYFLKALFMLKEIPLKSSRVKNSLSLLLLLFVSSKAIHAVEFLMWRSFELIDDVSVAVIYALTEVLSMVGLAQWIYTFITSRLTQLQSMTMPSGVFKILQSDLMSYLNSREVFTDPLINVSSVARHFHVEPHHISKFLNTHTGQSFNHILTANRIDYCIEALKLPSRQHDPLHSIYYEAGFNSKSVFNKAFKSITGETPSAYRKKQRHEKSG